MQTEVIQEILIPFLGTVLGSACVLDTDTPLKVKKYIRCGMKMVGEKKIKAGVSLYTMAYMHHQQNNSWQWKRLRWNNIYGKQKCWIIPMRTFSS
ncbi:MAG: hypothetical protein K2K56_02570 [Lachnospiraceae bacterium]|nr:hypothetical protein [Lachnospiraceae bacterium]